MFFSYLYVMVPFDKKIIPLQGRSHTCDPLQKRTSRSVSEEGSVTVEAAIVIPLLLCGFLALLLWGKVFILQQEVESALLETAREIAVQEHLLTNMDQEGIGLLLAEGLFQEKRKQGGGTEGVQIRYMQLLGSEYRKETKEVYLQANYQIQIPILFLGTFKLPLKTAVVQKAWNGYAPFRGKEEGTERYVYVTEHGEAFHTNSQCYHLHVTVRETKDTSLYYSGQAGLKPCGYCVSGNKSAAILYITEEGECYHEDSECGGLTRTVSYVEFSKAGNRRLCEDCARGE